jgi:hypothetical protein
VLLGHAVDDKKAWHVNDVPRKQEEKKAPPTPFLKNLPIRIVKIIINRNKAG